MITMMRTFSTLQANTDNRRQIADLTARVDIAGHEVATGLKADRFEALGSRAEGAMITRSWMARLEGFTQTNATLHRRLDIASQSLGQMRESLQGVLELAAPNLGSQTATGAQLQAAAQVALEELVGQANRHFEGVALFGGTANPAAVVQPFDTVHPDSGRSPRDAVLAVIGAGPTDADDAGRLSNALKETFEPGAGNAYESTFYNGTPRAGGTLTARIDEGETLDYGVQADDPAFTAAIRGLSMLAAVDVDDFADVGAQQAWTEQAFAAMEEGRSGLLAAETRMGAQRSQLERVMSGQSDRLDLLEQKITEAEGVDPYEAATRFTQLQTQLEASFAVTSRLSKLTFLNYM